MNIELDELIDCENCGIVFNYLTTKTNKEDDGYIEYKCPVCGNIGHIW